MPGTHFPLLVARGCGRSWACRTERRCSYRPPSPGSCPPRVSWPTCAPHGKASHLQGEAQPTSGPGATLRHRHRQEQTPRLPGPRHYPEHPVGPAGTQGLCTGVCPLRKQASLQDTGAWGLLGVLAHVGVDSFQALRPHLPGSRPVLCQLSHHHSTTALLLLLSRRFAPGAAGGLGSPTLRGGPRCWAQACPRSTGGEPPGGTWRALCFSPHPGRNMDLHPSMRPSIAPRIKMRDKGAMGILANIFTGFKMI